MTSIVYLAFVALAPLLTARMAPGRAVWLVYFAGLMLLPPLAYGAVSATDTFDWRIIGNALPSGSAAGSALVAAFAALLVAAVRDGARLLRWRPGLLDLPMALFCLWPLAQEWLLGTPADPRGPMAALWLALVWGVPWILGRVWLAEPQGRSDFIRMFVIAALPLVPVAYVETIVDWRLHEALFGPHPFALDGAERYLGNRPLVLFENGNQYGLYISLAALFAIVGAADQPSHDRKPWIVVAALVLTVAALASQSVGAIMLVGAAGAALALGPRVRRMRWLLAFGGAGAAMLLAAYSTGLVPVRQIAEQTGIAGPAKVVFEMTGRRSLAWRANQNDKTADLLREGLPLGSGQWDWFAPAETRPWGLWSLMAGQYGLIPLMALALAALSGWLPRRSQRTAGRTRNHGEKHGEITLRLFRFGTLVVIIDAALNSFMFYPLSAIMAACAPLAIRPPSTSGAVNDEDSPERTGAQNAATA